MNTEMSDKQNEPVDNRASNNESGADGFDLNIGGATGRTSAGSTPGDSARTASSASGGTSEQSGPTSSTAAPDEPANSQSPPRRPKSERAKSFNGVAWLAEGAVGLIEELRHNDLGLPAEFWSHAYAAQREGLLAAQTLLGHLVECSEKKAGSRAKKGQRTARRGSIQVE